MIIISKDMKLSLLSIFMISVVLSNSAPQRKCINRKQGLQSHTHTDDAGRVVLRRLNRDEFNNDRSPNNTRPRKRCCPYDFDSEKCQIVNDRKVCGYNMNHGGPDDNPAEQTMNVGNRCWFRRGRLECGYQEGPYEGIRRPPVYNQATEQPTDDETTPDQRDTDTYNDGDDNHNEDNNKGKIQRLVQQSPNIPKVYTTQSLPSCVEIRKKIVCNTL